LTAISMKPWKSTSKYFQEFCDNFSRKGEHVVNTALNIPAIEELMTRLELGDQDDFKCKQVGSLGKWHGKIDDYTNAKHQWSRNLRFNRS
jgi:hypothetical protein